MDVENIRRSSSSMHQELKHLIESLIKSGFNLFSEESRQGVEDKIKTENPHIMGRQLFCMIGQELCQQWRALSPVQQA
jgi:hypothetical protein